jgi:hypothetical protein
MTRHLAQFVRALAVISSRVRAALIVFIIALFVLVLAIAPAVVRAGEAPGGSHNPGFSQPIVETE